MQGPLPDLAGRVAVVTGSTRRIGRSIATRLADAGASVVINGRVAQAQADAIVKEIGARNGQSRAVACVGDITQPAEAKRLIETALQTFGDLDILINSVAVRRSVKFADITLEEWHAVLDPCLDGTFLCSQAAAPHLGRDGYGRIVNIGGTAGHIGMKSHAHVITAKAGLVGLTKALAHELGQRGVTVNCLAPGLMEDPNDDPQLAKHRRSSIRPDMLLMPRFGTVEDVVATVVNLCSPAWDYVTGQTIHVNGGMYLAGA